MGERRALSPRPKDKEAYREFASSPSHGELSEEESSSPVWEGGRFPPAHAVGITKVKLATAADGCSESYSGTADGSDCVLSVSGREDGIAIPGIGREVGTLTDVCYHEDLDEVNLVSLIEEQIPRYVLRADSLTRFGGYDHGDWIHTPCLPDDADLDLSPELMGETLKYFTLCGDRVSQMTRTYNDIEAVTRLLEEKERDLELAARIGQSLLEKNKELESKSELLEEQVNEAQEKIGQLRHDISHKDALLVLYNQENASEENSASPSREGTTFGSGLATVDALQKKLLLMEQENLSLQLEQASLKNATFALEEQEAHLMKDCVSQLSEANSTVRDLQDELAAKSDVNQRQQEDITNLKSKIISYDNKIKRLTISNAELQKHLNAAVEAQKELTTEISDMEDKYQEVYALYQEAQDEIRALRKKHKPTVIRQHQGNFSPFGSLASELEESMRKDESGEANRKGHCKKVMETARCVRRSRSRLSQAGSSTSGNDSCDSICGSSRPGSIWSEDEAPAEVSVLDADSMYSSYTSSVIGRPGIPGSNDLETALRRLSTRKANEINERMFEEAERKRISRREGAESHHTPTPCRSPDSFMSTGSGSNISDFSRLSNLCGYKMPDKLQIVKPMEGSLTLHHWQRLATPHMGGLLDDRDGVAVKGEQRLHIEEEELFSLSDFEEDDDYENPGKCADMTSSTYTYTTAKIMHPADSYINNTTTTSVYNYGGIATSSSISTHSTGSAVPVQAGLNLASYVPGSGREASGTSTFSMSKNLATELRERGTGLSDDSASGGVFPHRFNNIVTEVHRSGGGKHSRTETIYTNSSLYMPAIDSLGVSSAAIQFHPESAYLNLVEKIKDIGLNSILSIASRSGLAPVKLDPVDVGLNTIMSIKRNKGVPNRALAHERGKPRPKYKLHGQRLWQAQTLVTSAVQGPVSIPSSISHEGGMRLHGISSQKPISSSHVLSSQRPISSSQDLSFQRPILSSQVLSSQRPISSSEVLSSQRPILSSEVLSSQRPISSSEFLSSQRPISSSQALISQRPISSSQISNGSLGGIPQSYRSAQTFSSDSVPSFGSCTSVELTAGEKKTSPVIRPSTLGITPTFTMPSGTCLDTAPQVTAVGCLSKPSRTEPGQLSEGLANTGANGLANLLIKHSKLGGVAAGLRVSNSHR